MTPAAAANQMKAVGEAMNTLAFITCAELQARIWHDIPPAIFVDASASFLAVVRRREPFAPRLQAAADELARCATAEPWSREQTLRAARLFLECFRDGPALAPCPIHGANCPQLNTEQLAHVRSHVGIVAE